MLEPQPWIIHVHQGVWPCDILNPDAKLYALKVTSYLKRMGPFGE